MTRRSARAAEGKGPSRGWILAALALAVAAPLLAWAHARSTLDPASLLSVPMSDSEVYRTIAAQLASGGEAARTAFYWSPLYSLLLVPWADRSHASLVALQVAAGLLTLLLVFLAGRDARSARAGCLAAWIAALYAPFVLFQAKLLPATLATALAFLGTWLVLRASRRPAARSWLAAGLGFGAAGLLMPQLLLAPALVLVVLAAARPRGWARGGAILAASVLAAILPVAVRNAVVARDFVPVSSSAGFNLYLGFNPNADGLIGRPLEMYDFRPGGRPLFAVEEQEAFQRLFAERAEGRALAPSEVSAFWARRAVRFVRDEPGDALRLLRDKAVLALASYEFSCSGHPEIEKALSWPLKIAFVPWAAVLALGAAGLVLTWPERRALWPLHVLPAAVLLYLLVFFVNSRFRLPAVPALAVLGGLAIDSLLGAPREARLRLLSLSLAVALPVALVSGIALPAFVSESIVLDEVYGYRNLNVSAQKLGRLAQAADLLDRAAGRLETRRRDARLGVNYEDVASAYLALGGLARGRGDAGVARRAYDGAIRLNPESVRAYLERGALALAAGRPEDALADGGSATRIAPRLADGHVLRARALLALDRRPEAESAAASAARLDPGSVSVSRLKADLGIP